MADNLQELKIPDGAFDTSDVKSLDDVPSMTAAELKAVFDYGAEMIVTPALNALIDFLASSKAAGALGITGLDGISGTTIQGLLQEIKKQIDDRYTKEESDLILESLVSAVKFDLETGVIRVEKRDGSFEEIDTEFDELAMQAEESAKQAVESAKQAEESAKQAIEIVGGDFATNANLQAHTENEVRHITENERKAWNDMQNELNLLQAHTEDEMRHITKDERKAWNDKQDKLTFDNEPVSESLNPVTSGGIYEALASSTSVRKVVCGMGSISNEYKAVTLDGTIEAAIIMPYNYYTSSSTYSMMTPYLVYATRSSTSETLYVSGLLVSTTSATSSTCSAISAYISGNRLYARYHSTGDIPGYYYIAFTR